MDAQRICYHESGHVAAALTYGLPIIRVSAGSFEPHLLRGGFRRERTSGVEALSVLCLAGPAAEQMFFGEITDHSDFIDQQMAKDYLLSCFPEVEIPYQMTRAKYAAEHLVASSRHQITTVATALLRRGSLTGDEIVELLWRNARCEYGSSRQARS
jgi:ATP-dependent Zn protease